MSLARDLLEDRAGRRIVWGVAVFVGLGLVTASAGWWFVSPTRHSWDGTPDVIDVFAIVLVGAVEWVVLVTILWGFVRWRRRRSAEDARPLRPS